MSKAGQNSAMGTLQRNATSASVDEEIVAPDVLSALRAELDQELAVLRDPQAPDRLQELFRATPADMTRAANAAAAKRRKR